MRGGSAPPTDPRCLSQRQAGGCRPLTPRSPPPGLKNKTGSARRRLTSTSELDKYCCDAHDDCRGYRKKITPKSFRILDVRFFNVMNFGCPRTRWKTTSGFSLRFPSFHQTSIQCFFFGGVEIDDKFLPTPLEIKLLLWEILTKLFWISVTILAQSFGSP